MANIIKQLSDEIKDLSSDITTKVETEVKKVISDDSTSTKLDVSPVPKEVLKEQRIEFDVLNKTIEIVIIGNAKIKVNEYEHVKVKDGTYTSITFKGGRIVGFGIAPLPVYTPHDNIKK